MGKGLSRAGRLPSPSEARAYPVHAASTLDPAWRGAYLPIGEPVHQFAQIADAGEPLDPTWHFLIVLADARWSGLPVRVALTIVPAAGQLLAVDRWDDAEWVPVAPGELSELKPDCAVEDVLEAASPVSAQ